MWGSFLVGAVLAISGGDALWRRMVPLWPGGGYGFGAATGFLVITTWPVAGRTSRLALQLRFSGKSAGFWCLSGIAGVIGMISTAALLCLLPGRNGRMLGSIGQNRPMWAAEHPEVWWAIALGLAVGAVAVAVSRGTGRRRRSKD